jgi:hypothetical protein
LALVACGVDEGTWSVPHHELRIYANPYEHVDWANDMRLTAQHHDHVAASVAGLLAYDAAGYDVVSLMDYSGSVSYRDSLRERLWPANRWVPTSLLPSFKRLKVFVPNAEEVGLPLQYGEQLKHVTSPFLETYIEGAGYPGTAWLPNQYGTMDQLLARVREFGGIPCVAHPWNYSYADMELEGTYCVEVYSAYAEALKEVGFPYFVTTDRNKALVNEWDRALEDNQQVYAIAVNDHFGPATRAPLSAQTIDSGKILVLAKAATLPAYRDAFFSGSFFAVRDVGVVKNRYPRVMSIDVQSTLIFVETFAAVKWIANGTIVGTGPMLLYKDLPYGVTYVRAEIVGEDGSTVYTQAFSVRPTGDVNGDYVVGADDEALCFELRISGASDNAQRRACDAWLGTP